METAPATLPDLLYPLSALLPTAGGLGTAEEIAGSGLPEPYRRLLVHDSDMTSTLEAFHGEPMRLRLLERRLEGASLLRRVALVGEASGSVAELGAIRIELEAFEPAPRREILAGRRPLGALLAVHAVPYLSRPLAFFRLTSVASATLPGLPRGSVLYGRQNRLLRPGGEVLAEVLEILPPLGEEPAPPRSRP